MADLNNVVGKKTTIVTAKECVEQLKNFEVVEVKGVEPGDRLTVRGISIEAVAAYNTNKNFHPKADGKVGFVITLENMRIYHSGDTDDIPEMSQIEPDVA